MKKLFGYFIVLSTTMWGQQAVSPTINQLPTRQFGHPLSENPAGTPTQASPNLVEGRELNAPGQIAFDNSVNPPILYIADIGNNRVLAYKNPAGISAGKVADLVIGQQDMVSTLAAGPGTALSTGFNAPTGVAVDSKGNLYVADSGNNRILRFPSPFNQQAGSPPTPDLVIGQKSFNSGSSPNEGGNVQSKTLAFSSGGNTFVVGLAIDSHDNLWTTDPLNNRVLGYPAANLTQFASEPVATNVLGQNDFNTNSGPQGANANQLYKGATVQPSGIAFDSAGNMYVADAYSRVLYFTGPNFASQGQPAARILGISPPVAQGQPATVYPTQYSLGFPGTNGNLIPPNGVFTNGTNLFVADTPSHRIVEYDIPSKWAGETVAFPSPPALAVFGQVGFNAGQINGGNAQPNQFTLAGPYNGAFLGNQMWISDTQNNRVLGFAPTSTGFSGASVVVGQLDYIYNAPNLIVGSEVFLSGTGFHASAMVIDKSSNPPHLYVADPGNNRILCFNDARIVGQGGALPVADRVIGQPDLKTSEINYPSGQPLQPTATGLHTPIGVVVDNNGNLYVADEANGRVLRFPAPFSQPAGTQATANLVLGQSSFTSLIQNASANSMHSPWGVALFADTAGNPLAGGIAVSDPAYNRVLFFKKAAGGDFVNGQAAYLVIGQQSFSTFGAGNGSASFNFPLGIASDTSDRLYVADSNNNRVLVFTQAPENISNGPTASNTIPNLNQPQSVVVSSVTTELWVTNTNGNQILRYPEYTTCQIGACAPTAFLVSYFAPLGITLDAAGNVIAGDTGNRITFYFAQSFFRNAANYNIEALAPGMLALLGRLGLPMSIKDGAATSFPWPTTLSDINVTVNGTPAPIFATIGGYGAISFQVPNNAPTSGPATVIITQASTGAVLGVGTFQTNKSNPGFFTANQAGTGPVVARLISDSTPVTAANAVPRGADFYVCLTGAGQISGSPADGQQPTAAAPTPTAPLLYVNGVPANVSYSGIGCGFPGGWQINATVPLAAIPGSNSIVLSYNGIGSNIGGTTAQDNITPGQDIKITTTLYVK